MQANARQSRHYPWPLRLGFLHAILAEYTLSGADDRLDRIGLERLRHRDQGYRIALTARIPAGARKVVFHRGKPAW
jgi:hypothetical protein